MAVYCASGFDRALASATPGGPSGPLSHPQPNHMPGRVRRFKFKLRCSHVGGMPPPLPPFPDAHNNAIQTTFHVPLSALIASFVYVCAGAFVSGLLGCWCLFVDVVTVDVARYPVNVGPQVQRCRSPALFRVEGAWLRQRCHSTHTLGGRSARPTAHPGG